MSDDSFYASAREMAGDYAEDLAEARAIIRDFLEATDSVMRQNFSGFDIDEIEGRARAFLGESS